MRVDRNAQRSFSVRESNCVSPDVRRMFGAPQFRHNVPTRICTAPTAVPHTRKHVIYETSVTEPNVRKHPQAQHVLGLILVPDAKFFSEARQQDYFYPFVVLH
jgi:hypothetical protein